MARDVSEELANRIRSSVLEAQSDMLDGLAGKYVRRDGVTFLIVQVDRKGGKVVASDTKTPVDQTTTFGIKAFLSKAVEVLEDRDV